MMRKASGKSRRKNTRIFGMFSFNHSNSSKSRTSTTQQNVQFEAKVAVPDDRIKEERKQVANMLTHGLLPHWRRATLTLFSQPVFAIRYLSGKSSNPTFMLLSNLHSIKSKNKIENKINVSAPCNQNICEMIFIDGTKLTIQFSTTAKLCTWIDAVSTAVILQCGPKATNDSDKPDLDNQFVSELTIPARTGQPRRDRKDRTSLK
eukprot:jgi/Hompol1/1776/HPOL_005716-RA